MENEIRKLIEKYKDHDKRSLTVYTAIVIKDFQSLLEVWKNEEVQKIIDTQGGSRNESRNTK